MNLPFVLGIGSSLLPLITSNANDTVCRSFVALTLKLKGDKQLVQLKRLTKKVINHHMIFDDPKQTVFISIVTINFSFSIIFVLNF